MSKRIALLTGATGFVGSNLCRRLVQDSWAVHVIVIPNDNYSQLQDLLDTIVVHIHDGSTASMTEIIAASKPDVVFHLASLFLSDHVTGDISRLITSNIHFGTQLLEAMTEHGVAKIVNTGTSWQHFENKSYSPVNLYAATKQAYEDILQYYVEARGLQAITLKLFDTYGPNDPRPKLLNLLKKISHEGTAMAMSPGEQFVDLVHVNDVVEAFVTAAKRLNTDLIIGHEKYAVTSGNPINLRSVVKLFEHATSKSINIEWGGRPYRLREVMRPWTDCVTLPEWEVKEKIDQAFVELIKGISATER